MAADVGPPSAGVEHINAHGRKHFDGVLRCRWTADKGRVVHAAKPFKQGDIILAESPLHIVKEEERNPGFLLLRDICQKYADDFDYEPLWYWCALQSLTQAQLRDAKAGGWEGTDAATQHNLLLLHHEDVSRPSRWSKILSEKLVPSADAVLIERLTQIWVLNCFEYSDNPEGYSTYFFSSFMSHSCFPNAVWHYEGANHILRARRDISVDDEVCISYLTESGLLQSVPVRRGELHETKRFWCTCERCAASVDHSRGFTCTSCSNGIIFSICPKGSSDSSRDSSEQLEATHLVGSQCNSCQYKVTKAAAKKLHGYEKELQDVTDSYRKKFSSGAARDIPLKELKQTEAFIEKHFAQHVLADLAWEQLVDIYTLRGRLIDQRRLLELRCRFHAAAYPGLSGGHAWMLEALADALMKGSRTGTPRGRGEGGVNESGGSDGKIASSSSLSSTTAGSGGSSSSAASDGAFGGGVAPKTLRLWEQSAEPDPVAAVRCYEESLRILQLMFGERDSEYVEEVLSKHETATAVLNQQLQPEDPQGKRS